MQEDKKSNKFNIFFYKKNIFLACLHHTIIIILLPQSSC